MLENKLANKNLFNNINKNIIDHKNVFYKWIDYIKN